MTSTTTTLSVPAPADDTMEMSSPAAANRNLDEDDDIDIDFDEYQAGGVQLTDDERMVLEDGDGESMMRPGTATDDMMDDDVFSSTREQVGEEVMHVEEEEEEDEELIDYGEEDFHDEDTFVHEATTDGLMEPAAEITDAVVEPNYEEGFQEPDDAVADVPVQEVIEELIEELHEDAEADLVPPLYVDDLPTTTALDETENVGANPTATSERELNSATEEAVAAAAASENQTTKTEKAAPISLNTTTLPSTHDNNNNTPSTPTDTGLHPMTIRYNNGSTDPLHCPLFKSRHQPTGLLKNDNLASLSLAELIRNCRQRLSVKFGAEISEDQELVLGFGVLGLVVVEDSRAAFECSLEDVLEVYLLLCRNDGGGSNVPPPPPLELSLSLQLKFGSSFRILKQAAAGGQGMASFGFLRPPVGGEKEDFYRGEEEVEVQYDEDDVQGDAALEANAEGEIEGQEYDETTYVDHSDDAPREEELWGHDDPAEGHEEGEGEAEEHGYYEDNQEELYEGVPAAAAADDAEQNGDQEHNEATELLELHQGEAADEPTADTIYNASEAGPASFEQANPDHAQEQSAASSTTVQGEDVVFAADAGTNHGEYTYTYPNDDLIDWDSESLTGGEFSSEHALADDEDFDTFLTEYEGEGGGDTQGQEVAKGDADADADADSVHDGTGLAVDVTANPQHLGSEDFLNDDVGNDEQREFNAPAATAQFGDGEVNVAEYEEETENFDDDRDDGQEHGYDQADTYEEQQEEDDEETQHHHHHPDYLPQAVVFGEGDDEQQQFHTAHDFLDNDAGGEEEQGFYEHAPEHDVYASGANAIQGADLQEEEEDNLYPAEDGEYDHEDFGEELRFDDDDDGAVQHQAVVAAASGSPSLGKRSFDEIDELGVVDDDDEPEVKKAKSS